MVRWLPVLALLSLIVRPVLAECPADSILCEDFNTYCVGGGYPGGAGDPSDPACTSNANPDNALLQSVWLRTSMDESTGTLCGEEMIVDPAHLITDPPGQPGMDPDNDNADSTDWQVISSFPFGGRCPGAQNNGQDQLVGQATLKDWVAPNNLGLSRLIGNAFGPEFTEVAATDAHPLVLSFFVSSKGGPPGLGGRIWYSNGYLELARGDESRMNRANTDFGMVPYYGCCSPAIKQGPFPFMCAVGLPEEPLDLTRCPPPETAPVHNAIAIGVFAMIDSTPCNCGTAHGGTVNHPALYDGKTWWNVRKNNPVASTGYVTLLDDTPVPNPPNDLDGLSQTQYKYGNFTLYGGQPPASSGKSMNWITLTIRSTTFKIVMRSREISRSTGLEYYIYSEMDSIPRQYLGPFDRIRAGVGSGCELESNASWSICKANSVRDPGEPPTIPPTYWPADRHCIDSNGNQAYHVDFDDLTLSGGEGSTTRGACCSVDGTCTEELPENCPAPSTHAGPNTTCASSVCCARDPYVWADADGDGDVDADDFGKFQLCYTGDGGPMPPDPKCKCFDRGAGDNDVDGDDFQEFSKCLSGSSVPWSPGLTPNCVQ